MVHVNTFLCLIKVLDVCANSYDTKLICLVIGWNLYWLGHEDNDFVYFD